MTLVYPISGSDVLVFASIVTLLYVIIPRLRGKKGAQTTPLRGPPRKSFLYGANSWITPPGVEPSARFNGWLEDYGSIIRIPTALGGSRIALLDPAAVNQFYTKETWTYQREAIGRKFVAQLFGKGLLWAEAHGHRRQRKALAPAFSTAAIRHLTSIFFDSAHRAKVAWDQIIDASGSDEAIIEVQIWMNRISMDSIGIAGFSHDFNTLSGEHSTILDIFNDLGSPANQQSKFGILVFMASFVFSYLIYLPTKYNKTLVKFRMIMGGVAEELLAKSRNEKGALTNVTRAEEKSIIGLLIKAKNQDTELNMSEEQILSQWALIELCRHEDIQKRLREELMKTGSGDATYEQLMHGLPLLDAVVHEVLRLQPPVGENVRVATEDDVIPLSNPFTTATGEVVTSIVIKKGEVVSTPIRWINRCEAFWGADAAEFNPDRWLDDTRQRGAKEINGHRKLLTFSDGARICLGKQFALAEFKAVLSTLIKNYEFRFRDGKETKIIRHDSLLPRAKIAGEEGMSVPLVVKRLD